MVKLVIESYSKFEDSGKFHGLALTPRISRNKNLYTPKEIAKGDGITVPVDWEHNHEKIGEATFHYDEDLMQLNYEGVITSVEARNQLKGKNLHVSIEAGIIGESHVCNRESQDCYKMPHGLDFEYLAITENPGIPESTVIVEHIIDDSPEKDQNFNTYKAQKESFDMAKTSTIKEMDGDMAKPEMPMDCPDGYKYNEMTGECEATSMEAKKQEAAIRKIKELKEMNEDDKHKDAGVDHEEPSEKPCPDGKKFVNGECVDVDNLTEMEDDKKKDMKKDEDCECDKMKEKSKEEAWIANVDKKLEALSSKWADKFKEQENFYKRKYETTLVISPDDGGQLVGKDIELVAKEAINSLARGSGFRYQIGLDNDWVTRHSARVDHQVLNNLKVNSERMGVQEAVSYTNNQSNRSNVSGQTIILPNGRYLASIRHLCLYDEIPDGTDRITRTRANSPGFKDLNEGDNNTEDTYNVVTRELTANTTRGSINRIKKSDLENTPVQIISSLTESARGDVLDEEANLLFNTASNAVAFGDIGGWINGSTQENLKNATGDNVSDLGTFDYKSLVAAKQYFQERGYDSSFGNISCAIAPKQLAELKKDTEIQRYVQEGEAIITQSGDIAKFQGINLIPMNKITTTTNANDDALRAVVFVENLTYWLASHRNLDVNIQFKPETVAYDYSATHRKNAQVFVPDALYRISSLA